MAEPLDTAALRAQLAKALPGEWTQHKPSIELGYTDGHLLVAGDGTHFGEVAPAEEDDRDGGENSNAALIVAAVNALPRLLDEIDAARAELARRDQEAEDMRKLFEEAGL